MNKIAAYIITDAMVIAEQVRRYTDETRGKEILELLRDAKEECMMNDEKEVALQRAMKKLRIAEHDVQCAIESINSAKEELKNVFEVE